MATRLVVPRRTARTAALVISVGVVVFWLCPATVSLLYSNLGMIEVIKWRPESGEHFFTKALSWNKENTAAYRGFGRLEFIQGNYVPAIGSFTEVVDQQPRDRLGHFFLGQAYEALGSRKRALQEWRQARAASYFDGQCSQYMMLREYEKAEYYCELAVLINSSSNRYETLGEVLRLQRKMKRAIQAFESAVAIDPQNGGYHWRLGRVLAEAGNLDRAVKHLELAIQLSPDNSNAYVELGHIYFAKGDIEKARSLYIQATILSPESGAPLNYLGEIALSQGNTGKALYYFQKAISQEFDIPRYHLNLARAYHQTGKLYEAAREYRVALELLGSKINRPDLVYYRLELAKVYEELCDLDNAAKEYKAALEVDMHNQVAMKALDRLKELKHYDFCK